MLNQSIGNLKLKIYTILLLINQITSIHCNLKFNSRAKSMLMIFPPKIFFTKEYMRPLHVWLSQTPDGVRCAHFPSVITTIMNRNNR
jgi:hypothetical protein